MEDTEVFTSKFSRVHPLAFSFSVLQGTDMELTHSISNSSHYPLAPTLPSPSSNYNTAFFSNKILLKVKYLL